MFQRLCAPIILTDQGQKFTNIGQIHQMRYFEWIISLKLKAKSYLNILPMKSVQQTKKNLEIPKVQDANFIQKSNGFIKGYSVNTFHGLVKNYNEDRVSIIMNITKPNYKGRWPKCSYFGVFDGHGGSACSDFLKDNMHKYITENQYFPHKPIEALKEGFKNAEAEFLRLAQSRNPVEKSGSCALVLLVIDQICYIGNVGDSRAILSTKSGKNIFQISRDHKPDSLTEKSRILQAGGNIYQSSIKKNGNTIYGPFRIQPGKLSVSRSFGDIQAKKPEYGGNPRVLIAKPEITYFTIDPNEHDFIMMGSDGIFDKLENEQISHQFWNLRNQSAKSNNYQTKSEQLAFIGKSASRVITKSMESMSLDNLTTLFVVFDCEDRLINPIHSSREENYVAKSQQNVNKNQRSKSNAQKNNYNTEQQNTNVSKFSLKREVSKSNITGDFPKVYESNQRQYESSQREEERMRNITQEMTKKFDTQKSALSYRGNDEQNMPLIANRQPSMSEHMKEETMNSKGHQNRSIESKYLNKNGTSVFGEIGNASLARKKSHGLLRKESKKESVWGAISRGLKNNEKIEKIRY